MRDVFGWESNHEGQFPMTRVAWNLLWFLPMVIAGFLLSLFVAIQHMSIEDGIDVMEDIL